MTNLSKSQEWRQENKSVPFSVSPFLLRVNVNNVKALREDHISPLLGDNEDLALAGSVSKETIDFLTRKIKDIERVVEQKIDDVGPYRKLLTMPGVGKILGLTIQLETGPISRFAKVGNYVSYCRKVSSKWTSNGKSKGNGNKKNGNKYLAQLSQARTANKYMK